MPRVLVFDIDPASLFYQYYSEDADVKSSIHLTSSGSTCSCRCQVGSVVSSLEKIALPVSQDFQTAGVQQVQFLTNLASSTIS